MEHKIWPTSKVLKWKQEHEAGKAMRKEGKVIPCQSHNIGSFHSSSQKHYSNEIKEIR